VRSGFFQRKCEVSEVWICVVCRERGSGDVVERVSSIWRRGGAIMVGRDGRNCGEENEGRSRSRSRSINEMGFEWTS
jgi:hypothetical protein